MDFQLKKNWQCLLYTSIGFVLILQKRLFYNKLTTASGFRLEEKLSKSESDIQVLINGLQKLKNYIFFC